MTHGTAPAGPYLRSVPVSPVRRVTGTGVPSLVPVSVPTRGGIGRKPRVAPPGCVTYCRYVVGPHPGVSDRSAGDSSPVTPCAAVPGDARVGRIGMQDGAEDVPPPPLTTWSASGPPSPGLRPLQAFRRRRAAANSARPVVSAAIAVTDAVRAAGDPVEARLPPPLPVVPGAPVPLVPGAAEGVFPEPAPGPPSPEERETATGRHRSARSAPPAPCCSPASGRTAAPPPGAPAPAP